MIKSWLNIAPEVENALFEGNPVVALESTIIAHGMPYPQNVETALRVESIIRQAGAIPATCAIIDGKLRAGLSVSEIEDFGKHGMKAIKASRRDVPYLVSQKMTGATTVASTMIIAHQAQIRIFATGGIGGVHRGAATTFDISADLQELAQTPVAVISAGAKSILDLGLTLEYLETYGVPVIGYQTADFPAFYARSSGHKVDFALDTPQEIADLLRVKWEMGLGGGALVCNPVPESWQLDRSLMEATIAEAVAEAERLHIKGKDTTPFLLSRIEKLSEGRSLATNIELVCNNALLGAQIAVSLQSK